MSDKNDIKRLDVKLHNFIVRQNEANNAFLALVNWAKFVDKFIVAPKMREKYTQVCMSAIL